MIGTRILHYQIIKKLGEGGMGAVYLAQDLDLGRHVALKVLSAERLADDDSHRRFLHEAKAQAMLSHPNVATFYEVKEHEGKAFIVMEYVEGQPLSAFLQSDELACDEVLDLAVQIAEGVRAAHEHGVVHRDIKPDNIMITTDRRVKITDFGLARWTGASTLTKSGTRLGSTYYMSPEQAETRRVDARTDIFSIGVILYELFCKRRPFEGDNEAVIIYNLVNSQPQPLARYCRDASESVEWIVMKCLAKNPDERYQSAADLVADLKRARHELQSGGSIAHPSGLHRRSWIRRHPTVAIGASILASLVLAGGLVPQARIAVLTGLGLMTSESRTYLAVIPFAGVGEDPPSQSVLDGLLETLTSKLTQMKQFHHSLSIVPASDVRRLGVASVREARQAFGVTHAVTGSMQNLHDRIRITLNLVDADREEQLRSSVIDEPSANAFAVQDSTVVVLASLVNLELLPVVRVVLTAGQTNQSQAYDYYLRGRGHFQRYTSAIHAFVRADTTQLDSAIGMYHEAVRADPDYSLAYAALGEAYWRTFLARSDSVWMDKAIGATLHAIELDDQLAFSYVTLGRIHKGTGRYLEAVHNYKNALRLDALIMDAYSGMATAYTYLGQLDEAEAGYRRMTELQPDYARGYEQLAAFYSNHGMHDDARAVLQTLVDRSPEGFDNWNTVGAVYYSLGEWDQAREIWEQSLAYRPGYAVLSNLGTIYFSEGLYAKAAAMYERALAINDGDYQVWINLAAVCNEIPDRREEAHAAYLRAIEMGEAARRINPKDGMLDVCIAGGYMEVADTPRALILAERALQLAPDQVDVVARAGIVYEQAGRRTKALELIGHALTHDYPRNQLEAVPALAGLLADPRLVDYVEQE